MSRRSFRHPIFNMTLIVLFVVILVLRALAPGFILRKLNDGLATASPVYKMHVGDLDLGLLTFSYRLHDIEAVYRKTGETFFKVQTVRVQISLRELLHGRILTNVRADNGRFVLTKALIESNKEPKANLKETSRQTANALFPIRISVVEIHHSSFDFADFVEQDRTERWRASEIEAKAFNINPLKENPYTTFMVQGQLLDSSPFKVVGKAKRLVDPLAWKVDAELKGFSLPVANHVLYHDVPFTFKSGTIDLYSEVKSEGGQLSGYFKPFVKDATILDTSKGFKNVKHFFFEVIGAFGNWVLKNSKTKTTATKIAFHEEGGSIKVDVGDALKAAVKNGFDKPLAPGTDDTVPFK